MLDVGGGTYDFVIVRFLKLGMPKIVSSDYGDKLGGSNVDRNFLNFIKDVVCFDEIPN